MDLSQRRKLLVGRLKQRKSREKEGLVLVEGVRSVGEALRAGAGVRFAVRSPRLTEVPSGSELLRELADAGAEVLEVDERTFEDLSDTSRSQGVMLVCGQPGHRLTDVLRPEGRYLVLDALQDPGNVGTLIRAAVAFAVDGVLVLDGSVDPWGAKAVRASAGMVFRTPVVQASPTEVVTGLGDVGVALLLADLQGTTVSDVRLSGGWALVVGNEGAGPRMELRAAARDTVTIPMSGDAESLNAGVAGAILLYALTQESERA